MSEALLVRAIVLRLRAAGYKVLATPFRVASVDFEFTAALLGSGGRALDLILIVDTATGEFGDRNAATVRQRIESLSRALDVTQSRYLLTVILAGASLTTLIDSLSSICRVLTVENAILDGDGHPNGEAEAEALDDHIRLLLPLDLPGEVPLPDSAPSDPITEFLDTLPTSLDQTLLRGIAEASSRGEAAVTRALGKRLGEVLAVEPES
jgi:hypothetical protein